ncbi:MAG: cytidine deaminase [Chitinophagaceae bacterium]
MGKQIVSFEFEVYASSADLIEEDRGLLEQARAVTKNAYAPYSHFNVSAVALLANGNTVAGVNLENASYPAGICAEQALLGAVNATAPGVPIKTIAISYQGQQNNNEPISPCGICRQALTEYEVRTHHPIRLILAGQEGAVYIIPSAQSLLPLAFTGKSLRERQ